MGEFEIYAMYGLQTESSAMSIASALAQNSDASTTVEGK